MKKKLLIAGGVVLVFFIGMFLFLTNGLSEGLKVQLNGIDLSNTADGSYIGVYDFKRWSNTITVHVKDHLITGMSMIYENVTLKAKDNS